jgi:hypothetical protein
LIEEIDDDLQPIGSLEEEPSRAKQAKVPLYLRELISALRSEDVETLESALGVAAVLVRSHPDDLGSCLPPSSCFFLLVNADDALLCTEELAVPLVGVLLHMSDEFNVANFAILRREAMVALTIHVPVSVAEFVLACLSINSIFLHRG